MAFSQTKALSFVSKNGTTMTKTMLTMLVTMNQSMNTRDTTNY